MVQSDVIQDLDALLREETAALAAGDIPAAIQAGANKTDLVNQLSNWSAQDKAAHAAQLQALQEIMRQNMTLISGAMQMSERVLQRVAEVIEPPKRTQSYSGQARKPAMMRADGRGLTLNTDA